MESDLIAYTASSCLPARAALVLAPHPDDEVFGCGGAIAAHVRSGATVQVVILTDGAQHGDPSARRRESEAAAQVLGCETPEFWLLPDRGVHYTEALVHRIAGRIAALGADLVYAPSPWEVHPDHRQACMLAMEAVKRSGYPVRLAFYEVGVPLRPNTLVDISAFAAVKQQAMQCFVSQLAQQDYSRHIGALNSYRTYSLPASVQFAEAYWVLSAAELAQGHVNQMLSMVSPGMLGSHSSEATLHLPLVSVLIRSMDRKFLAGALDSVALQTYPNLEIVVVAALPGHSMLPERLGPFALRLIQTDAPLLRSRAANVAMAMAQGELLLFLDDDDWLMPGHIARLAEVMIKQPSLLSAYTGISLVDSDGRPTGQVFDLPFDATRQLAGNLTPIHAVMFRTRALQLGVCFDEALNRYEDWDFWLQLSRLAPMVHLPGVSGVYRVHDSSGVHEDGGPTSAANLLLYQKQKPTWTETQIGSMMERVWGYADMEIRLLAAQSAASDAQVAFERAAQTVASQSVRIDSLMLSTSWRITQPLRSLSLWLQNNALRNFWRRLQRAHEISVDEGWRGIAYRLNETLSPLRRDTVRYDTWVRDCDTPSPAALAQWQSNMTQWPLRPLISVLMPVYNPPLDLLKAAVASIQAQIYPRWELCIADDASPDPGVWQLLQQMSRAEPRIKVMRRSENGHISNASNSALSLVEGEFVVLMDNDDLLPKDALHWVAEAVNRVPSVQMMYSDEDKLNAQGQRFGAYFKPDWNYTLFLGQNLFSHLGVYRASLLRDVGGFRVGMEGSQDYDLTLRCIERVAAADIVHIPRVLYHWRAVQGSTALAMDAKPYASLAAQRALQEHRVRIGQPARFEILPTSNYHCLRLGPGPDVRVSLILISPAGLPPGGVPAWTNQPDFRVLEVLPCASSDVAGINNALTQAQGDLVALVRADLAPTGPQALLALVRHALEDNTGIAGGTVRNATGALVAGGLALNPKQIASVLLKNLPQGHSGYMGRGNLDQELSALSLDCVVMRRAVLQQGDGLDPELGLSLPGCVAFCLRLGDRGLRRIWCPEAVWLAHGKQKPLAAKYATRQRDDFMRRFGARYAPLLQCDPAYHPALDAANGDFSLTSVAR